ncbi:MAG: iron-containing alcohol dehydrogenase [Coriobacteriales bacterium]|jgi:alcohol dehydrogenase class IV|nr:iron-containing alcohol dehydrogenase [Coriobacteriales bacterium]
MFSYNLPVNILFGCGTSEQIGRLVADFGQRALIVTGKSSARRSGLLDRVVSQLEEEKVTWTLFDEVEQNPLTTTAEKGAAQARQEQCTVLVALGGGSVIDAAKGIAFMAANTGDINDYIFGRLSSPDALPLVAVPTTCGTGSEGNSFAVFTNPQNGDKKSLRCKAIVPAVSIVDPLLMTTMPPKVLASVGFDALCHGMEAFISRAGQPLATLYARECMRLAARALPRVYASYEDILALEDLTWAATLGGMSIGVAGVALPHSMEHPASGLRNLQHGRGLAALTPPITDASCMRAPELYEAVGRELGVKRASECGDALRTLLEGIGLLTTLGAEGIEEKDVDWMTENCFKVSAAGIDNHPVSFDREGIRELYVRSL